MPTIGALFAGAGGLELGVQHAIPSASVAWHSEIDPAASRILAHHWPDAPNHGDITRVDWATVEPVDILTGGFPCQDVSHAGQRRGLRPGTRSGLWTHMAYAIDQLRPALVVAENVRGILSAEAHSDVEPCPWCVGGPESGEPPLRALGAVLGDLADIGYDAAWTGLRAADVGAPHGRFRVFVIAWPADSDGPGLEVGAGVRGDDGQELQAVVGGGRDGAPADTDHDAAGTGCEPRHQDRRGTEPAQRRGRTFADTDGDALREQPESEPRRSRTALTGLTSTDTPADTDRIRLERGGRARDRGPGPADRGVTPTDTQGDGRHEGWSEPTRLVGGPDAAQRGAVPVPDAEGSERGAPESGDLAPPRRGTTQPGERAGAVAWGNYRPAVERWERVLGRLAPAPTELGTKGGQRLAPAFVEWLMGLDAGHVTDVPGLTRNDQLKALGNGVVPAQAAEAVRRLLLARSA